MNLRWRRSRGIVFVALFVSACGDSSGPPPVALIQLLESLLSAEVATQLSFRVRIDDAAGLPIEGVPISFTPTQGSGTVSPTSLTTAATGQVTITWTLGETAGTQSVRVSAGDKSITVEATATPGPPVALVATSGEGQTGPVGAQLGAPVVAQVQDRFGNGVAGVTVSFTPEAGSVATPQVVTDADGAAQTTWTLGELVGAQSMSADSDPTEAVTFAATAEPGPPSSLVIVSGSGQSGEVNLPAAEPIVLEVRDEFANAAEGAEVTFSGDGSTDPASATVDSEGRVSLIWTLGTVAGAQTLTATAGAASAEVLAEAAPGPPANVEALSGDGQETFATATLDDAIVVRVLDEFANAVPDATVSFAVTAGGGTAAPAATQSGDDGQAQSTWTLGVVIGAHALEAQVDGAESAVFAAQALSGPPAQIIATGGAGQTAEVATTLPEQVSFRVTDIFGTGVLGVPVTLTVTAGGGGLDPGSGETDGDGALSTTWTLGTGAGTQQIRASVAGPAPATVEATAVAGPPTQMVIHAGDGQSPVISTPVLVKPAVRVMDAFTNPIAGISVTFAVEAGGGAATGLSETTDAAGVAAVGSWTVGGAVGLNTLTASATGLAGLTFAANAVLAPVFDIEVRFVGTAPSAAHQAMFEAAAARWEQLITGDLPDIPVVLNAGQCFVLDHDINETVDDLLIFASVEKIDSVGGVLGSAGPCFVRLAGGLSIVGGMRFDVDDLDDLDSFGSLDEVIMHEIGHVLGLGAVSNWYSILEGRGGADPFFPGAEAVARYTAAGGTAPSPVPVEASGGAGTRDSHWRESHMVRELMTGFLQIGVANPLSAISVGALQDMGYTVDVSAAEAYTVFPGVRLGEDRVIPLIEIALPPPMAIDELGRITPIRR